MAGSEEAVFRLGIRPRSAWFVPWLLHRPHMTDVSACLVTRGDVDMQPIIDSLPKSWEIVIWDNGARMVTRSDGWAETCHDLAVYGRYAAIEFCTHSLILTQDDDVIVSDPQAIVDGLLNYCKESGHNDTMNCWPARVACNMPTAFRAHYPDSGLVGFGAAFHRDAPRRAFARLGFNGYCSPFIEDDWSNYRFQGTESGDVVVEIEDSTLLRRRADNVFTTLTPRVLVDVPYTNLSHATDADRMYRQPGHVAERDRMIELARRVRDSV